MPEDTTAEFTREDLVEQAPPLKMILKTSVACKSDLGRVRENNEDKFEFYIPEDENLMASRGSIFVVCDGMGGHAAGQIASELACKTFLEVYLHHYSADGAVAAGAAVEAANRFILDVARAMPSRAGMGTTLSAIILRQDEAISVQIGDSRIYRFRDEILEQISEEHSFVEEQVKLGLMSREEAARSPYAHVLTRALGVDEGVQPHIAKYDLREGDIFLLCSDGLTNHVTDVQIHDTLAKYAPSESVWRLVNAALIAGGSDNCTALCVRVDEIIAVE
ncbi:MAG TPA: protein phosphatase 2C domain-containing protein [Fimbriimonadales bacterium]|jgi:protein phosphatase|nr:protein phosphatase 2C domain-containing protein [Fimbriimonadales bacterium]